MVFILGLSLGVTALFFRSAIAIAAVGLLVVAAFSIAAIISYPAFHLLPLLIALAGYNVGIASGFIAAITMRRFGTV